jgi:hypothetical protein
MRNVVVEGPDNTGKSTLIRDLCQAIPELTLVPGAGPERYPGEINVRVRPMLEMTNCIFDRHPCVSQMIYGRFRSDATMIEPSLLDRFYNSNPFFIYCFGSIDMASHVKKDYDTLEHLAMLNRHREDIEEEYTRWAYRHHVQVWYAMSCVAVHWGINDPPSNFYQSSKGVIDAIRRARS